MEHFTIGDGSDSQTPYAKKHSSMRSRDCDEPSTEKKRVRGGDETPASAHSSHLEVPIVSSKSGLVTPLNPNSRGLGSPPSLPVAAKSIAAKSQGGVEPTLEGFEDILSVDIMGLIETRVLRLVEKSGTVTANLDIDWDLLGFMKTQYHDNRNARLGSVITLTGTALRAQATTCSEYSQKTWPAQGSNVISAFQKAIDSSICHAQGARSQQF